MGHELERGLRGARVNDAGLLPDGRFALVLHRRGESRLLAIDPFGSPPDVTVESGELGIAREPGFVRAVAQTLRGTVLTQVRARMGDRLLRLTFSSRSRFGIPDDLELYVELVPRFGNVVLTKRETVVAAVKEFSPADNRRRSVLVGHPYEPPPLPPGAPQVPRALESSMARERFLAFAQSDEPLEMPLYVYRRNGAVVQAHLLALPGYDDAASSREGSLLDVLTELRIGARVRGETQQGERRRATALKRLDVRERRAKAELAAIQARRQDALERDALRAAGEEIFATLHALPAESHVAAKDRAAKFFARYRKLGAALPHLDRRERDLREEIAIVEALRWETQRVAPEDLEEIEAAAGSQRAAARPPSRRRKRPLLEIRTASGSRILVGRSPLENAHLTFEVARPGDLWFHAQGIPGAHVILARDDRREPPPEDLETAAALAAQHSRAKGSGKVPVDYTARKHVRKQRNAPPGLVWYANAKTLTVAPASGAKGE